MTVVGVMLILLQVFTLYYLYIYYQPSEVVCVKKPVEDEKTDYDLPLNAKWMKVFKNQLRMQRFVDKKHRNGVLAIYTLSGNVELGIDWWVLRRMKSVNREDLYSFIEDHTGLTVRGISANRYRKFVSFEQAREHKRNRAEYRLRLRSNVDRFLYDRYTKYEDDDYFEYQD